MHLSFVAWRLGLVHEGRSIKRNYTTHYRPFYY